MKLSVILCTYNRSERFRTTLESVASSQLPATVEWEVLVVDNNSTDNTRQVLDEFCRSHPRFRYLFEAKQGLSHARNAGIREARGDVIAFVDDDVTVDPCWLHHLTAPLDGSHWAGVGGRIRAQQTLVLPKWLRIEGPYSMGGSVAAAFDRGDEPGELREAPYGTNMAYRKCMFDKYGHFRGDLGRSGGGMIGKEDIEFGDRLIARGERLWYAPSAIVYHPVLEERLTKAYLLSWWFGCGQSTVRQRGRLSGKWGLPRYFLSAGMVLLSSLRWFLSLDSAKRFFWKCSAWMYAGKTVENYRQIRDGKRKSDNLQSFASF